MRYLKRFSRRIGSKVSRHLNNRKLAQLTRRCATTGTVLRPYQAHHILEIDDQVGLTQRSVLEIGGDLAGQTARGMVAQGAHDVTSINIDEKFDLSVEFPGIERKMMNAASLDFPDNQFDLSVGIAVLEHFLDFPTVLSNVYRVLKPGGYAFFQGGPLWMSAKGHHLVVDGRDGECFHFATENNPLDDWSHLTHDPTTLRSELVQSKHLHPY